MVIKGDYFKMSWKQGALLIKRKLYVFRIYLLIECHAINFGLIIVYTFHGTRKPSWNVSIFHLRHTNKNILWIWETVACLRSIQNIPSELSIWRGWQTRGHHLSFSWVLSSCSLPPLVTNYPHCLWNEQRIMTLNFFYISFLLFVLFFTGIWVFRCLVQDKWFGGVNENKVKFNENYISKVVALRLIEPGGS